MANVTSLAAYAAFQVCCQRDEPLDWMHSPIFTIWLVSQPVYDELESKVHEVGVKEEETQRYVEMIRQHMDEYLKVRSLWTFSVIISLTVWSAEPHQRRHHSRPRRFQTPFATSYRQRPRSRQPHEAWVALHVYFRGQWAWCGYHQSGRFDEMVGQAGWYGFETVVECGYGCCGSAWDVGELVVWILGNVFLLLCWLIDFSCPVHSLPIWMIRTR